MHCFVSTSWQQQIEIWRGKWLALVTELIHARGRIQTQVQLMTMCNPVHSALLSVYECCHTLSVWCTLSYSLINCVRDKESYGDLVVLTGGWWTRRERVGDCGSLEQCRVRCRNGQPWKLTEEEIMERWSMCKEKNMTAGTEGKLYLLPGFLEVVTEHMHDCFMPSVNSYMVLFFWLSVSILFPTWKWPTMQSRCRITLRSDDSY